MKIAQKIILSIGLPISGLLFIIFSSYESLKLKNNPQLIFKFGSLTGKAAIFAKWGVIFGSIMVATILIVLLMQLIPIWMAPKQKPENKPTK